MNKKNILITVVLVIAIGVLYGINYFYSSVKTYTANAVYKVYLNGEDLGLIADKDELYALINKEQQEIKDLYKVDNVYPPASFDIVKTNTYDTNLQTASAIYKKIEQLDDFTIEGYKITISFNPEDYGENEEVPEDVVIYTLQKDTFTSAINNFVYAFVDEDDYNKYINNDFEEIEDEGMRISDMYFKQDINIKKEYISVKNKIYTKNDVSELSQYLLFGENATMEEYTVALGDTIASISEENQLNPQEFLVANPIYKDENSILPVGSKVNVTLIQPVLDFVYNVYEVSIEEEKFKTTYETDTTKNPDFREISVQGVNGLKKYYKTYEVKNGEASSEINFLNDGEVIRNTINQVIIIGSNKYGYRNDLGGHWAWPTNSPWAITSGFEWRWGKHHDGIDISGPGKGSPIYAALDGTVVEAQWACSKCNRWAEGTYVVIEHENNMYTLYAHMSDLKVSVGDTVTRSQIIGAMGETGYAFGVHLHFSVSYGWPYHGSYQFIDPRRLSY